MVSQPGGSGSGGKKELNFDLNLVPFMDLLSVCIYFLLLSAVWIQIAAVPVKQAVGGQPNEGGKPQPMINVKFEKAGELSLTFKNPPPGVKGSHVVIKPKQGQQDLESTLSKIKEWKTQAPQVSMAIFQPGAKTVYQDIIQLMDQFRELGLKDLGVAPL